MKRKSIFPLALALFATAGCQSKSDSGSDGAEAEISPTAAVKTVKLERKQIAATVTAFGSVVAQPNELVSVSVQYESKVSHLLVSAGELVKGGQPLIEVEPSPDTKLALADARSAAESAKFQLERTQTSFEMKLAVNAELQQARQAARDADAKLESLIGRGAGEAATLKAETAGVLESIDVSTGQIVAAGSPLLAIVPSRKIEIRLGVEGEDVGHLKVGQPVKLSAVNQDGVSGEGKIRLIASRVNPQTRLVDVFVTVPPDLPLLLDGFVRGEIRIAKKTGLVVPRDAVLPGEEGETLFTVAGGRALKHSVTPGIETDTETEITGPDLKPGDEVVTEGNSQLEDGMQVTTGG
jgi:RND family efflux transporter MFP subunit